MKKPKEFTIKEHIFHKEIFRDGGGKISVLESLNEIKEYKNVDGCYDMLWYLIESATPTQIPYCPQCIIEGNPGALNRNYCSKHKRISPGYAFSRITKDEAETNIDFIKRNYWIVEAICDASGRQFDSKKIVKGIIEINNNNSKMTIEKIREKLLEEFNLSQEKYENNEEKRGEGSL